MWVVFFFFITSLMWFPLTQELSSRIRESTTRYTFTLCVGSFTSLGGIGGIEPPSLRLTVRLKYENVAYAGGILNDLTKMRTENVVSTTLRNATAVADIGRSKSKPRT